MKEKYESLILTLTQFDKEDVITTSDLNNAYKNITELIGTDDNRHPPTSWY